MGATIIKLGEVVHFDVATHSPSGGFVKSADETPRFMVFEEATDTPIISPTNFTERTGFPGLYRGSFTASSDNGFDPQFWYNVIASGKVEGIVGLLPAMTFFVESNSFDSLYHSGDIVRANVTHITGLPITLSHFQSIWSGDYAYYAELKFIKDATNSKDEYTVQWYKNTTPLASGAFASPTLQVFNRTDGTSLIGPAGASGMQHVNTTLGVLKYDELTNRTVSGEDYIGQLKATIDGSVRTWHKLIGRDS